MAVPRADAKVLIRLMNYPYDRSSEIRFHLLRGPVILTNKEVGIEVRYKGRLLGFGPAIAELLGDVLKPLPSAAVFHGIRIAYTQFLDDGRVKLTPDWMRNPQRKNGTEEEYQRVPD